MRTTALTLLLAFPASLARAQATLETWGFMGTTGDYYGSQIEAASPVGKGYYSLSARMRTMRFGDAAGGTREEYSAGLRRELYHVTVGGRLGTSPPNMERAEYHVAGGDALFTFYGLTLGPEHPGLSPLIWESTAPVPAVESLDRTWVTRLHLVYTNTNFHLERPVGPVASQSLLVVVENSWQLQIRETWRDSTSAALELGHDRYNRVIGSQIERIFLDNVQYPGHPFALASWPNNYVSGEVSQRLGEAWKASFACTRLNLMDNGLSIQYGTELERRLGNRLVLRAGYYHKRRRGIDTRDGVSLNASWRW